MTRDIREYIRKCTTCEKTKIGRHTKSPLQITSTGGQFFDHAFIDYVGVINPPSADDHKYILTATCDLTKFAVAIPTHDCTALTTAKALVDNVFLKYNIPTKLTSDNGNSFVADIIKEVTKLLRIRKIFTTAYRPQGNIVERMHRTMNDYLKAFTEKEPTNWHSLLTFAMFSYNNTAHSSTGFSPNELAFGFTIKIPTSILENKVPIYNYENYRDELRHQLYNSHQLAKEHILKRKLQNKVRRDKTSYPLELAENDLVLVKKAVKDGKFDQPYEGPFRVEKILSPVTVLIKKGRKSIKIHRDRLKLAKADYGDETPRDIQ